MNNWFKFGLPILIAVLLVTAAVAITLAATSGNQANKVIATSYSAQGTPQTQLARSANCGNCTENEGCTGNGDCNGAGNGNCTGNGTNCGSNNSQGNCCSGDNTGVYIPKTSNGGSCCSGR